MRFLGSAWLLVLIAGLGCRADPYGGSFESGLGDPRTPTSEPDGRMLVPLDEAPSRDPRLDGLGLVYDDTVITTSARTVDFNGQALVPRLIHVKKSGAGQDLAVDMAVTKVVFGLSQDLTLAVVLPYVSKRLDPGGTGATRRAEGLGDSTLIGKYRFFQHTAVAETTEAALLFGFELPTGRDDVRDDGLLLPQPLQPGSGSLDLLLGGAFTRIRGRWLFNTDLIAKLNSEANDYSFGDSVHFDIGGHYRLTPARYERFDQLTVNLVGELNGSWAEADRSGGTSLDNSGGTKLLVTPGMQVILNQSLLFEAALQLPLWMDLKGTQLEEDYVAVVGLRFRF